MDNTTASTIGTIAGAFAASFLAQMWGNFVTRKVGQKTARASAAQTTVDEIKATVEPMAAKVDVLVNQSGVDKTIDHRSPKKE